jgi:arylsulfatase A-like enzyme
VRCRARRPVPADAGEDSYNILPALLGKKSGPQIREATILHSGSGKFVIRQGDWVLIDAKSGDDNGVNGEPDWFKKQRGYKSDSSDGHLYNLRQDISQGHNLYAENPDVVSRLKTLLAKYETEGRSAPLPR